MKTNEKGLPLTYKEHKEQTQKVEELTPKAIEYFQKLRVVQDSPPEPERIYTPTEVKVALVKRANTLLAIQGKEGQFVLDEQSKYLLNTLFLYFTSNPEFETMGDGFSLNKGLFISGEVGRGKTSSLQIFADIKRHEHNRPIKTIQDLMAYGWQDGIWFNSGIQLNKFVSCKHLSRAYATENGGWDALTPYLTSKETFTYDDLGWEQIPAYHYKSPANVMEDVIDHAWKLYVEHGIKTHFTSNVLSKEKFTELYGERGASRMRAICNQIYIDGVDRRG